MEPRIVLRDVREDDAREIARIGHENGAYYARLAPDYFRIPDEEGFAEWFAADSKWREQPTSLALVAEVDGEVAGYLEASLQEPLETARFQAQRDLGERRLFINYVETADAHKRTGVATRLVRAAEEWGRSHGAVVAVCDTYVDSPLSVPFWERRMGYARRAIVFRKPL